MKQSSLWLLALTCSAWALPEGPNVIHGSVQVVQPQGHILQVLQSSPQAIINWNAFSIQANQLVQFLQGNAQSVALNRVVGGNPSHILGQLSANGRVFLVNPNGILFGPQSTVNAGSFVASTLQISDQDFLAGRYEFRQSPGDALASIVNQGHLEVGDQGWLVLLSPLIDNQGLIVAQQGQVVLGASQQATLTLDPAGLLQLALPGGPAAPAGPVLLSSDQASATLSQVVSASSLVEAGSIVQTDQGVVLEGSEGVLLHQGQIDTQHLQMNSSQATVLAPQSSIDAQAGFVEVLSQGTTWSGGSISNPDGFVEISGARLGVYAPVEVGTLGTLLLDPGVLRVTNNPGTDPTNPFQANGTDHSVNAGVLAAQTSNVTLQADDDIIVESGVVVNFLNTVDVLFEAGRDILMEPGSALIANDDLSTIEFRSGLPFGSGGRVQLQDVLFNNIEVVAEGIEETQLFGDLGRAGSATTLSVQSPNITLKTGSQVNVLGSTATVQLEAVVANLIIESGAQLNLPAGNHTLGAASDITISGSVIAAGASDVSVNGDLVMLPGSLIEATQGRIFINGNDEILLIGSELNSPQIAVGGTSNITILQTVTMGTDGVANDVSLNASPSLAIGDGSRLKIRGSQANLVFNASNDIVFGENAQVDFAGTPGNLTSIGAQNVDLQKGSIVMPEPNSNLSIQGVQSIALGDIEVASVIEISLGVGPSIEVAGTLSSASIFLATAPGGSVIGTQPDAEIFARDTLLIDDTDHIYGSGPQQSLTLRSGPTANILLDILGENFIDSGPPGQVPTPVGVAGSLLYLPPQSPNLTINSPNGQVRVLTEVPSPDPPPPPVNPQPTPAELDPAAIESRQDLTQVQQAMVTQQLAQSAPQLANLVPPALASKDFWDVLSTTSPGLTSFYAANPSSLVVETVVLSPEEVSQKAEEQERMASVMQILLADRGEDDEDVRFWRALMERVLIWEEED